MSAGYLAVMFPKREELTTVLNTLMPAEQYASHVAGTPWSTPVRMAKAASAATATAAAAAAADGDEDAHEEAAADGGDAMDTA